MRGVTLLLATALTGTYTFAATSAIVADRRANLSAEVTATSTETGPVWYGGILPPVTVEVAPAEDSVPLAQEACPAPRAGVAAATGTRLYPERVS